MKVFPFPDPVREPPSGYRCGLDSGEISTSRGFLDLLEDADAWRVMGRLWNMLLELGSARRRPGAGKDPSIIQPWPRPLGFVCSHFQQTLCIQSVHFFKGFPSVLSVSSQTRQQQTGIKITFNLPMLVAIITLGRVDRVDIISWSLNPAFRWIELLACDTRLAFTGAARSRAGGHGARGLARHCDAFQVPLPRKNLVMDLKRLVSNITLRENERQMRLLK